MRNQIIISATFILSLGLFTNTLVIAHPVSMEASHSIDPDKSKNNTSKRTTTIKAKSNDLGSVVITELRHSLLLDFGLEDLGPPKERTIEIFNDKNRRVFKGVAFTDNPISFIPTHRLEKGNYKLVLHTERGSLQSEFIRS